MSLRLAPLEDTDRPTLARLSIAPGQERFVAAPAQMLGEQTEGVSIHVIWQGDQPIGFFKIDVGNPHAMSFVPQGDLNLRGLFIDAGMQGRGFGRQSMSLLASYLAGMFPDHARLTLAVHIDNRAAITTYLSAGFQDSSQDWDEHRSGRHRVLRLQLDQHRAT